MLRAPPSDRVRRAQKSLTPWCRYSITLNRARQSVQGCVDVIGATRSIRRLNNEDDRRVVVWGEASKRFDVQRDFFSAYHLPEVRDLFPPDADQMELLLFPEMDRLAGHLLSVERVSLWREQDELVAVQPVVNDLNGSCDRVGLAFIYRSICVGHCR